jgi:hypothetical protein
MNLVKWKCGCIQIENEPVYLHYCEGKNFTDYRLKEYCFSIDPNRVCEKPFEIVSLEEKLHILHSIRYWVNRGYDHKRFCDELRVMVGK